MTVTKQQEWDALTIQGYSTKWKRYVAHFTLNFMKFGLRFFAIRPFTTNSYITVCYTVCWIVEIIVVLWLSYHNSDTSSYTIGGLVSSMLFLSELLAHLTLLVESLLTRSEVNRVMGLFVQINRAFGEKLWHTNGNQNANMKWEAKLLPIITFLAILMSAITWSNLQLNGFVITTFWYSYPSALAIKFRLLQLLLAIMTINDYIELLQRYVNEIGMRNLQRLFGLRPAMRLWQKSFGAVKKIGPFRESSAADVDDDERKLVALKNIHNEIFLVFAGLNNCFGWSLLVIMASYFIDLLCNSYFLFAAVLNPGRDTYVVMQNGGFVLMVIVLLAALCWHCQKSYNSSCYIGCLIYKLVKPMGNKRYNDLVSEFSLQALHQQYIITAKHFFQLNLNLLGSMVAAIVTYLVILIQFLLTEQSATRFNSTTIGIATTAGTSTAIMTTLPSMLVLTTELEPVR